VGVAEPIPKPNGVSRATPKALATPILSKGVAQATSFSLFFLVLFFFLFFNFFLNIFSFLIVLLFNFIFNRA
jgi:hypothetical protein